MSKIQLKRVKNIFSQTLINSGTSSTMASRNLWN